MPVSPPSAASDEATLSGKVHLRLSRFWQELLRDPFLPSGAVRFFETNVLAGRKAGRAFFMRPVYDDILATLSGYFNRFQNARERVDFAITGTPGLFYLLVVCLFDARSGLFLTVASSSH